MLETAWHHKASSPRFISERSLTQVCTSGCIEQASVESFWVIKDMRESRPKTWRNLASSKFSKFSIPRSTEGSIAGPRSRVTASTIVTIWSCKRPPQGFDRLVYTHSFLILFAQFMLLSLNDWIICSGNQEINNEDFRSENTKTSSEVALHLKFPHRWTLRVSQVEFVA